MSTFNFNIFSAEVQRQVRRINLEVNETLFLEESKVESIYKVETGCVRLVVFPQDGKQLVLYRARDGEAFAEEHLARDHYSYRAIADKKTTLQSISKQLLLDDISSNPDVAKRFLMCLSGRYYQLRTNFERLGISSARARVLHMLESLAKETSGPIHVLGKIKSLSDDLNLTHEATYRALRELENDGVIARKDGYIEIL